jgi:hypothetical protein
MCCKLDDVIFFTFFSTMKSVQPCVFLFFSVVIFPMFEFYVHFVIF